MIRFISTWTYFRYRISFISLLIKFIQEWILNSYIVIWILVRGLLFLGLLFLIILFGWLFKALFNLIFFILFLILSILIFKVNLVRLLRFLYLLSLSLIQRLKIFSRHITKSIQGLNWTIFRIFRLSYSIIIIKFGFDFTNFGNVLFKFIL